MEYYPEYPIRCMSCFEQIACYADDYNNLVKNGMSSAEALDALGIINPCSRIAMLSPTTVLYNMENRTAIEGIKPVNIATKADDLALDKTRSEPAFALCIPPVNQSVTAAPAIKTTQPLNFAGLMPKSAVKINTIIKPLVPSETKTEGVSVQLPKKSEEFIFPTMPGVPTINTNLQFPDETVVVGPKMKTYVLTGSTFIAK